MGDPWLIVHLADEVEALEEQLREEQVAHMSQCEIAYDLGKNAGYEDGFEEGKRWEP